MMRTFDRGQRLWLAYCYAYLNDYPAAIQP
jgi:hypothetical protein